jgi:hypothetical protein
MDWENLKGPLMVGGLGMACYFVATHLFFRRRGETKLDMKKLLPERDRNSALADAPNEVLRWQVEMHETARELKAELDTKMRALHVLMRDADERIARLEQLGQTNPPSDANPHNPD